MDTREVRCISTCPHRKLVATGDKEFTLFCSLGEEVTRAFQ